jgi:HD superfamily phosphodiesterase
MDLTKYEKMYDTFDGGHDKRHLEEVRNFSIELGKLYCSDKLEQIYVAATLHDVGLSIERENHEHHSLNIIKDDQNFKKAYTIEEQEEILEAIKEHRASSGSPKGIVARIVSDADKIAAGGTNRAFSRAYEWGVKRFPEINHPGQLLRAAQHLYIKFGPNGTGTRLYFEESKVRLDTVFKPIFETLAQEDLKKMESFLTN